MREAHRLLETEAARPRLTRHESLGHILVRRGLLDAAGLERAIAAQRASGGRLGDILVAEKLVGIDDVVSALAEQLGIPALRSTDPIYPEPAALELLSSDQATKYRALPLAILDDGRLRVAMADPLDLVARDDLAKATGHKIAPVIVAEEPLAKAIQAGYVGRGSGSTTDEPSGIEAAPEAGEVNLDDLKVLANDAPIVKLVNSLIVKAIRDRASDIHVEPQKKRLKIRYRIDGVLYPLATISRELSPVVTSRLKIVCNMDIAERRLPQDGRFSVVFDNRDFDLRVSSLPGIFGEKIVLRILYKDAVRYDFDELGFSADAQALLRKHVSRSQGALLLTGPTGSGKTTTIYACLSEIDRGKRNVVTLEDPVEYQLPGIHQVQVNPKIGFSFAAGLRTVLRQDPDVIMVGEVRDKETAEMAIRASLTGHLVLSTLHTNDAMGTITRLVNMEIEPFLVTEAVSLVGAQRLVRATCPACRVPYEPEESLLRRFGLVGSDGQFLRGAGCGECRGIGYNGRIAILELAEMTADLRESILKGKHAQELRDAAVARGMVTLLQDGIAKAKQGLTTLDEVLRVCAEN